jgi:hypothetical protein
MEVGRNEDGGTKSETPTPVAHPLLPETNA